MQEAVWLHPQWIIILPVAVFSLCYLFLKGGDFENVRLQPLQAAGSFAVAGSFSDFPKLDAGAAISD